MKYNLFTKKKGTRFIYIILFVTIVFILTIFKLGYKIPQKDKHMDWPFFPQSTNDSIQITVHGNGDYLSDPFADEIFKKYRIDKTKIGYYSDSNNTNGYVAQNIKIIERIIVDNKFVLGSAYRFPTSTGNSTKGLYDEYPTRFDQTNIEYLKINIGNKVTNFKIESYKKYYALSFFYQINAPKKVNDTLYFLFDKIFYEAYVKNK